MALSSDLAQFANGASGIYRLEFDKSQTAGIPADQTRLVVGFSRKGPFQTPVYIPDTGFFTEIFGGIDRNLERKGSFFHRTALAALERGPILALNLMRLDDIKDLVDYTSLSTSACEKNNGLDKAPLSGFYNKDRFWVPDQEAFMRNEKKDPQLIQFTNIGQRPVTILVRHAENVKGFDITAREWFGMGNVPEFMHELDWIKDYMIDVVIIEGDWSRYEKLAMDSLFSDYFDKDKGLIKSKLSEFLADVNVNVLAAYTGSLIPDFIDMEGNNLYIESQVNFDSQKHGIFCAINKEKFDLDLISGQCGGVDLIGHNLEYLVNNDGINEIDFLSYRRNINKDYELEESTTDEILIGNVTGSVLSYWTKTQWDAKDPGNSIPDDLGSGDSVSEGSGDFNYVIGIETTHSDYSKIENNIFINKPKSNIVGSYILVENSFGDVKWAPVTNVTLTAGHFYIELSIEDINFKPSTSFTPNGEIAIISYPDWFKHGLDVNSFGYFIAATGNSAYNSFKSGLLTSGDMVKDANETAKWFLQIADEQYDGIMISTNYPADILGADWYIPSVTFKAFGGNDFFVQKSLPVPAPAAYKDSKDNDMDNFTIQSLSDGINLTINTLETHLDGNLKKNEILISKDDYNSLISVGDLLVAEDEDINQEYSRLTRITRIITVDQNTLKVITDLPMRLLEIPKGSNKWTVERYQTIEKSIKHYRLFTMNGFEINSNYHMPTGKQERVNEIYFDALNPSSNLYKALLDKEIITYRYIIDSFGLGIQNQSKHQLAKLAKDRQNATAILNAPSIRDFKRSTDPRFVDARGSLSARLISEGGDLTLNPTEVYSLPSINNGGNYCGFYAPYITVLDRGKDVHVPPAGYVSNNFIDKYTNALPWSIIAGPRRGVIGGNNVKGLEINFNDDDRKYLEPFGINPIVFQRGIGLVIQGNKTAQQSPKSALSSLHVREVLIYIEDAIAEILKTYHWEFNTPQSRLEILTLADNFMNQVLQDQGVYDYKNIMDSTNNTSDVIGANMGVLDTYVEPVKGLEILVHRTTILKQGAISTGQFM